ncbi:MAG: alkaline phosphatase family protein [Chloroflexota bacterium]
MKPGYKIAIGLLVCVLIAVGAYFWANALMDSVYAFRSPLQENPPQPGMNLDLPLTNRLVFVLIDALRDDTSHKPEVMPFLNALRGQGAWATMHSRPPSYSSPSWAVLMIGAWPDLSDGPAMNPESDDIPTWTQDNLFSAAHRSGLKTAVSGYFWFEHFIPGGAVDAGYFTQGEDSLADRQVVDAAIPWLQSGEYEFILIHLDQVDYAGHYEGGPRSPNWDAAATRSDNLLREIASYLDFGQDTLVVLSDHGQIDQGGHGGQDPIVLVEPFVMVGAGVAPGQKADIQMVDVAPTMAALLGTNLPAAAQGRVLREFLTLSPEQESMIHDTEAAQKAHLLSVYQSAIGVRADEQPATDTTSDIVEAMEAAQAKRLRTERVPRFALATFIALVPLGVMVWKRGKTLLWLLGGVVLYLAIFHTNYALISERTYSLSSVKDAMDIILSTLANAAISIGIAWLVISFVLGVFLNTPGRAAGLTLGFIFVVLYFLLLPVLWSYAWNGALVTWTLPDFASMFFAFISLLQILVVAFLGLLLPGLSALISVMVNRRGRAKVEVL